MALISYRDTQQGAPISGLLVTFWGFFSLRSSFKVALDDSLNSYFNYFHLTCSLQGLLPEISFFRAWVGNDFVCTIVPPYIKTITHSRLQSGIDRNQLMCLQNLLSILELTCFLRKQHFKSYFKKRCGFPSCKTTHGLTFLFLLFWCVYSPFFWSPPPFKECKSLHVHYAYQDKTNI